MKIQQTLLTELPSRTPLPPGLTRFFSLILFLSLYTFQVPDASSQLYSYGRTFMESVGPQVNVRAMIKDYDDFIWVGTTNGLYRFDGVSFELLGDAYNRDFALQHPQITTLFEDSRRNLWIGTPQGVHVLSASRDKLLFYPLNEIEKSDLSVPTSMIEVDEAIWVADGSHTMRIYQMPKGEKDSSLLANNINLQDSEINLLLKMRNGNIFARVRNSSYCILDPTGKILSTTESPIRYQSLFQGENGNMYVASPKGIYLIDISNNHFERTISFEGSLSEPTVFWTCPFTEDNLEGIWLGTSVGELFRVNIHSGEVEDFTESLRNRIFDERFFASYTGLADGDNALWLGTSQGIIYLFQPVKNHFKTLPLPGKVKRPHHFSIRGITELRDGSVLVGSYSGLFRYMTDGTIKEYTLSHPETGRTSNPLAYDFLSEGDNVWIASEGNSLLRYDFQLDTLERVIPQKFFDTIANDSLKVAMWLTSAYRSHEGRLWLGSVKGLFYQNASGKPARVEMDDEHSLSYARILHIAESPDSVLWISCNTGLFSYSKDRTTLRSHRVTGLVNIAVSHFIFNQDGTMWIATQGEGLKHYDPVTQKLEQYTVTQGLPDISVYAIQRSADNKLWISTNNGLTRFDPVSKVFTTYLIQDGLPNNEFNQNAYLTNSKGLMYFGGVSGVVVFEPDFSLVKSNSNNLRISKISWHDGNAGETRHRILSANIRPEIRLSPKDKYFTVFYSSRDMQPGTVLNAEYRLVGLHSDWQLNGAQNYVQLSNLNPGDYELQIRSVTDASSLNTPILSIPVFVATPPGHTWWAYTLYILIAVGLGFILFREYFNRIHIRKKLKLEREHSEKLEEINRSKATFFTNITHEFKTPLTLIKGPAEEIESGASDPKIRKFAQLISRNANAILDLVTQLLELSKLEANIERGQFHRIELVGPFTAWVKRFESMARQKQIRLSTETDQATLYMDCDPVKLETICNNLLSNAIKFTPSGGEVKASLRQLLLEHGKPEVQIRISDTGPGIDEEEQLKIFDRYYQGKNSLLGGTGIGLSFVKELVRLHNGEVELSSEPGKGSVFTVRIPVHHEKASGVKDSTEQVILQGLTHQDITSEISENWEPVHGSFDQEAYILVAEDHADIANLVKETLSPHYHVKIAEDGRKAHELAIENIPDLVITDVMMPVMDGFRLTRLMKNDVHTNHIPIIMLTAKDGLDARLEGRIHGADLYLNKPFSPKELLLSVNNLLRLRSNLMQHASKDVKQDFRSLNLATDLDKAFYSRFISELENRMSATSLSVSEMVEVMNMSRTQLHRKLKAITGQSYSEIVRSIRLQKALSLLRHSGMNVTEVAYEVGYSAPSYFSESFKEYFGYSPSEAMS